MLRLLSTSALIGFFGISAANAGSTFMLGGTVAFGSGKTDFGVSARALSSETPDSSAVGAGVTWYPGSNQIGIDVIAAWLTNDAAIGVGYDFTQRGIVATVGYAKTK